MTGCQSGLTSYRLAQPPWTCDTERRGTRAGPDGGQPLDLVGPDLLVEVVRVDLRLRGQGADQEELLPLRTEVVAAGQVPVGGGRLGARPIGTSPPRAVRP